MRRPLLLLVTIALLAGACTGELAPPADPEAADERGVRPGPREGGAVELPDDLVLAGAALTGFDDCESFLSHVRARALEVVTPWGIGGSWGGWDEVDTAEDGDAAVGGPAFDDRGSGEPAGGMPEEGVDFSGTNVQEQGVDEPDHVKTDGRVLYVAREGRLTVLDVTGDDPQQLAELPLRDAWDAQLLLAGDRLLVTTSGGAAIPFPGEASGDGSWPGPGGWGSTTTITLLDVSDPSAPEALERLTVDGTTLSARLVDGVARVVVRTEQGNLAWQRPEGSGLRAERRALEANRQLIRTSTAEDWLPWYVHETADGASTDGPLLACNRVTHPREFAGLGVLSVLSVDLDAGGLTPGAEAIGVLAGGDTVYASRTGLYVATTRWFDPDGMRERDLRRAADETVTEVHGFDITDPRTVAYLGSGTVPGTLLSQWAMSEHDRVLRVASTIGATWWWDGDATSESLVTTLAVRDGELRQLGQVAGLGPTERIYAVRFLGEVGYVVTFRETDPLYTLDLSDPTDPRVTGELKILGYSAYLHPLGDGLLLGIGQDADLRGRALGMQVSLFDVSDPADPRELDKLVLSDGSSEVEWDHRAFLHWPATGLAVVPFSRWVSDGRGHEGHESGAIGLTATRADGLQRVGTVGHLDRWREELGLDAEVDPWRWYDAGWEAQIRRSLVVGERLVTVSGVGVGTDELTTLEPVGWLAFGRR